MSHAAEDRTALLRDAADRAARYGLQARRRPVAPPADAIAALERLGRVGQRLHDDTVDPATVLARLDDVGSPATMTSNGGRYFGFVNGGTDAAAQAAAILVGAWDQNVALPVMSPVAAHLDALAAGWVCELLGLPSTALATFCGGATIANLTGLLAGRDALLHRLGWSVERQGLAGAPQLRVVTGAEVHISVLKALRAAGIGRDAVTFVPTDDCGRIIAERFPVVDDHTLVVLQAGNVNTGHSDPFDALIGPIHQRGGWVHVDGAFGLWAAAAPNRRRFVEGVQGADSFGTDAHKWLNVPYDSGITICARGEDLRRALATDAAYVATDAERAPMHLSLQMSQRARGVETWAMLAANGRRGLAELIERSCRLAERLADRLAEQGVRILAPVVLNQALAHFDDDAVTDEVIDAVQRDGTCWAGATTWQGRRAMRLSVSDASSDEHDIDTSAAAIVDCWRAVRRRSRASSQPSKPATTPPS